MFTITIQLSKGKLFQKPPTEVIHKRLRQQGLIDANDFYRADYDSNDGKLIIRVDENQVNPANVSLESRNYSKIESRFKR